ncbi:hypothetical protein NE237_030510 [Protea cynaroides]|uniref:Uncharacterized protein n=1 Tax=Protea cynaroides TaxID=273540 RepID=A0A9Q0GW31_9MAGN|nr:hypothetical protein NE237_030510 [Protea cynaroides]
MADIALLIMEEYERRTRMSEKPGGYRGENVGTIPFVSLLSRRLDEAFVVFIFICKIYAEIAAWLYDTQTMARKSSSCVVCENSNLASICALCVNYRLNKYKTSLKSLKSVRDSLYLRLSAELIAKGKADDQHSWKVLQEEKLAMLRDKLLLTKKQLMQGKAEVENMSNDLQARYEMLDSALSKLKKSHAEQLEKFYPNLIRTQKQYMAITSDCRHKQAVVIKQMCELFPQCRGNIDGERKDGFSGQYDQICSMLLPRGVDPHSVPSEELAASLGYMVQLLNLVVHDLAAPALHNSGFAGSYSRVWQRKSYWDAQPSSRSHEYPLFIPRPRQNSVSSDGENSWSDRSSSNFGVASLESEKKPHLEVAGNCSFNYSSVFPHSIETHNDLQKGISLLKKSVSCITAYCYNSMCLEVPTEASTFEAFAKLLATLSSSKEVLSVFPSKMAYSRSCKQVQQSNKSVWHLNSPISSSSLLDSTYTTPIRQQHNCSIPLFLLHHRQKTLSIGLKYIEFRSLKTGKYKMDLCPDCEKCFLTYHSWKVGTV